jgi:hypothetical protein
MRRLFESAGYSWDDPLSAASFAYWHDRLPAKRDAVETTAGAGAAYIIQTMTSANPISQASLTLRAADLHAVTCTLRFGDAETVEMTEIADVEPAPPAGARPVVQPEVKREPVASPAPVRAATAGDELLAVAALHRIGADLGEPIEVKRQGENVVVRASGLDQQRMEQVRAALAGVPVARLESGELTRSESKETERRPGRQADSANPLYAELQSASPDLPDRITESMERLIARAYALRGLARRYPPDIAASLTAPEAAVLGGILHDHLEAAASTAAEVANLLAAILPRAAAASGAGESWQAISLTLPDDARRLDEALNEGRKPGAAQALADFRAGLARLRGLIPQ